MKKEIKIPDIAENVEKGTVAKILVNKGDKISEDQPLVEIETDKASTDIPSPYEGEILEIKVNEGDEVEVNQVIILIDAKSDKDKEEPSVEEDENERIKEEKEPDDSKDKDKDDASKKQESDIPASPSVRRIARELAVDLKQVRGTDPGERITIEDVKNASGKEPEKDKAESNPLNLDEEGRTRTESMNNVRRITAKNVQYSWQNIPHVTQYDEAITDELEEFRLQNKEKVQKAGGKLTPTALLTKISAFALQQFARFNSSLNEENNQIVYKEYYNIGIAVDTLKGLLVPVIKDVLNKSLMDISIEITELSKKARSNELSPGDMKGGTFTISNLGGIGGTNFTPIIYHPQVAILGISQSRYQQVYINDKFEKRLVLPLSLSYDHRVIDGADGARFLRWICNVIENPYSILL